MQQKLTIHGYQLDADGLKGEMTTKAIEKFQRDRGMEASTKISPAAKIALDYLIDSETFEILKHELSNFEENQVLFFGVRKPENKAGRFDDVLGAIWRDGKDEIRLKQWIGTTDPGVYWLNNPGRMAGTAILKAGLYKDVWKIDLHNGKYKALCQRAGVVTVWRDSDRDSYLSKHSQTYTGYFGINIHHASLSGSTEVGRWSAGCQVHAWMDSFKEMMGIARMQTSETGRDTFSYMLIEE